MGRKSGFERVVGVPPEKEEAILGRLEKEFNSKIVIGQEGQSMEQEKSPELQRCIEGITRCMHGFLAEYGVSALDIRPDQVHFLDPEKISADLRKRFYVKGEFYGAYSPENQMIFMPPVDEQQLSSQSIARKIVHEMMHFNSFGSLNLIRKPGSDISKTSFRRGGLIVRSGGFLHFRELNEAVTEELTMRFARKVFKDLSYTSKETEDNSRNAEKRLESAVSLMQATVDPEEKKRWSMRIEEARTEATVPDQGVYATERARLNKMIDDIFSHNEQQFQNREDVFKIFVDTMLKGHLLPLARVIEKTYGKGSFGELAEEMEELINPENKRQAA